MSLSWRLSDMRLGVRLALSMCLLLALVLGVAALAVLRLDAVSAAHAQDVADRRAKAKLVNQVVEEFGAMSAAVYAALLVENAADLARQLERVEGGKRTVGSLLEELDRAMSTDDRDAKGMLQAVHDRNAGYLVGLTRFTRLLAAQRAAEAKSLLNRELTVQLEDSYKAMQELSRDQSLRIDRSQEAAAQAYRQARAFVAALGLAALGLAVAVAFWLARRITAPLASAVHMAHQVAAGDLTGTAQGAGQDETGQLMQALVAMNTSLTHIVSEVRTISDALANASSELAIGNSHLLQRTEEQASSLEESATSMEQLTATVKQNAADAQQASELAHEASAVAGRGGVVMGEVVKTMAEIEASARRVEDISGVINGIAFQTNILALNAAVEAARAGQQGRGFAVVASEVRALAQRSAEAAKEIKLVIADSAAKVTQGTRLVDEAGRTMEEIVSGIRKVSDLTSHISDASREQSSGIDQVNQALSGMERMTQQNAGLAEESAAAMESLKDQARRLVEAVGVFRLAGSAHSGRPAAAPVRLPPALAGAALAAAQTAPLAAPEEWKEF